MNRATKPAPADASQSGAPRRARRLRPFAWLVLGAVLASCTGNPAVPVQENPPARIKPEEALPRQERTQANGLVNLEYRAPANVRGLPPKDRIEPAPGEREGALPELSEKHRRNVSLEFRDVRIKAIFEAISRQTGLDFSFDKDVSDNTVGSIVVRDHPLAETLDMLLVGHRLGKKVLGPDTLLIFPDRPDKRREYEDMMVKGFFLANADPKQVLTLVKTMAHIRNAHVDEKLNAVIVRDTPAAIRLAEKLVQLADQPEPEVVLEVAVLEVKRTRLLELGMQWPSQLTASTPEATTTSRVEGGVIVTDSVPGGKLTLAALKGLGAAEIGVSTNPSISARKNDGGVNILANPRIRVRNREKARIHVGEKVPVITTNTTSTGIVSESVSYIDVGLKLDVEPLVHLDGDVAIKIGMEVSNIAQEVRGSAGTLAYQLGSRNANTVLRLHDGETQALAGLLSEEDRHGAGKVPGLGDIPLLGRLFSSHRDESSKTEIVLLITPRIVRNVVRPELLESEFHAEGEAAASTPAIRPAPFGNSAGIRAEDDAVDDPRPRPPARSGFLIPRPAPADTRGAPRMADVPAEED